MPQKAGSERVVGSAVRRESAVAGQPRPQNRARPCNAYRDRTSCTQHHRRPHPLASGCCSIILGSPAPLAHDRGTAHASGKTCLPPSGTVQQVERQHAVHLLRDAFAWDQARNVAKSNSSPSPLCRAAGGVPARRGCRTACPARARTAVHRQRWCAQGRDDAASSRVAALSSISGGAGRAGARAAPLFGRRQGAGRSSARAKGRSRAEPARAGAAAAGEPEPRRESRSRSRCCRSSCRSRVGGQRSWQRVESARPELCPGAAPRCGAYPCARRARPEPARARAANGAADRALCELPPGVPGFIQVEPGSAPRAQRHVSAPFQPYLPARPDVSTLPHPCRCRAPPAPRTPPTRTAAAPAPDARRALAAATARLQGVRPGRAPPEPSLRRPPVRPCPPRPPVRPRAAACHRAYCSRASSRRAVLARGSALDRSRRHQEDGYERSRWCGVGRPVGCDNCISSYCEDCITRNPASGRWPRSRRTTTGTASPATARRSRAAEPEPVPSGRVGAARLTRSCVREKKKSQQSTRQPGEQRQLIAAEERSKLPGDRGKKGEFDSKKGDIYNLATEAAGPQPDAESEPAGRRPIAMLRQTRRSRPSQTPRTCSGRGSRRRAGGLAGAGEYWLSAAH